MIHKFTGLKSGFDSIIRAWEENLFLYFNKKQSFCFIYEVFVYLSNILEKMIGTKWILSKIIESTILEIWIW